MKVTNTTHFGIQRKIVANMTAESWETIPHVTYNYEPDVTEFLNCCNKNSARGDQKISINTFLLKAVIEGLKAAPAMNSHIKFSRKLVRGRVDTFENIDISMPMILPNGEMMTVNLHNTENMSAAELQKYILDVRRRAEKTNLNEAMFEVSMDNTINGLKRGKLIQTVARLVGSKTGKYRVKTLSGKEKEDYFNIPETDRLTKRDIEQGTVTVSNVGSLYKGQRGSLGLLEIIPPQVSAFGLGALQDKPTVVSNAFGEKEIAIRKVLPICIAFDHRCLDFGDIVPFIKRLDEIFDNPEQVKNW